MQVMMRGKGRITPPCPSVGIRSSYQQFILDCMCTSRDPIFLISTLSLARLTLVKACQFSGRACVHEEVDSASSFDFGILCLKRDHVV